MKDLTFEAEKIYERFVNYEWNEVSDSLKESILKSINEALKQGFEKRVEVLTLTDVSQQRELLLAYEQSKCPETWWMSKNQAENEVDDFIANNCS